MPPLPPPLQFLSCAVLSVTLLAAAPLPVLTPGRPVEREIAPGESHVFQADLEAGRPWRVAVEQRGVDVTIEVRSPEGRRLVVVDSPVDRQGWETVLVEPEVSGLYEIEIRARELGAPSGRYAIGFGELDPRRLAAERAVTRAGERYFEGSAEARRQALAEERLAAEAWRTLGDRREEARALYAASVLARLGNETKEALQLGLAALPLWQALGDRLWEAATWNETGLDRWLLGETAEGRAAFEKAVAIQREIGDRYGEGAALSNLCVMDLSRGELRAGLACYQEALPVLREVKAAALEGSALTSVGRVYDILGEPEQALAHYRQALERLRATGNRSGEARTLNHIGLLQQELGEVQEALAQFGQALEVFRSLEDARWQAYVLHNEGLVYQSVGEWARALSCHEEALRLRRGLGDPREEASTLTNLGVVERALGRLKEASEAQRRALDLYREAGDRWGEGVALTQLGRTALEEGDRPAALAAFDRAVEMLGAAGSLADQAEALCQRGEAYVEMGQAGKALESLGPALDLARSVGHGALEAKARYLLAEAEHRLGHPGAALAHVGAALEIFESLRTRVGGDPELRSSFSAAKHHAYELQVALLMEAHRLEPRAGHDREALEASERARARTLLELLNEAGVDAGQGDPRLLERRASLQRRLDAKTERALRERPQNADQRQALEEERLAVLRDLDTVEAEIREGNPAYAALTRPEPLGVPGIQALLDPETLMLSYSLGEERSFLWAVTAESLASFELPGRAILEEEARRFHEDLSGFDPAARGREAEGAADLGRLLLGPVTDRLGTKRLVVVPDGALEYVPFGALAAPVPILQNHEIVVLPSASALAVQRRILARRPASTRPLAVLADPVFDPRDPRVAAGAGPSSGDRPASAERSGGEEAPVFERLPGSRREAEAIAALAPGGASLVALDFDASRGRVQGEGLSAFRVIHFATHGILDAAHPALSGLALSMVDRQGRPQDGFLHLRDVYGLRLNADLVVLSGCRTALGREVRGEGLLGLTRGFFYAGAPRVIASLWRVEDQATAALMSRFYRGLWAEGLRPAAALRAAQLSLRQERRWRDPYFWAGFVLEGDWR